MKKTKQYHYHPAPELSERWIELKHAAINAGTTINKIIDALLLLWLDEQKR